MASKTFWQVFTKTARLWGYSDLSFSGTDDMTLLIKDLINSSIIEVNTFNEWYLLETTATAPTVADQNDYTLPTWIDKLQFVEVAVWWVSYFPEEIWQKAWNDLHTSSDISSDIPTFFIVDEWKMKLYPTPVTAWNTITFHYIPLSTELDITSWTWDENTSIQIKEWFENLAVFKSLEEIYLQREEVTMWREYRWKYTKLLDRYRGKTERWTTSVVTKRWLWRWAVNPNLYPTLTV